jgi:ferritin-like metal-binding protein YciE
MTKETLRELYVNELKDIFSAENQLTKALPKMAKAASSEELREGFEDHLEQTKQHVERLEQIFEMLEESPDGKKCLGMEGLIKEGAEVIGEDFEDDVKDSALIAAAQRVEHYEIAAYGTVAAYADVLGETEQASLLRETLQEEKDTDEKLTELATEINAGTEEGEGEEVESEEADAEARPATQTRKPKRGRAA